MSLHKLLHRAMSSPQLDEAAQHALLTLSDSIGVPPGPLAFRDDAAPSVLTRILADHGPHTGHVRAAALHPSCPLDAVVALARSTPDPLLYLADRDDLPREIALPLLARSDLRVLADITERSWLQAGDVGPVIDRFVTDKLEDEWHLDQSSDRDTILTGIRNLCRRFPAAVGRHAVARARAGRPPYGTQMLLPRAVIDELTDGDRDLLARHLILDPLARIAARPGATVGDELHETIYQRLALLTDTHRAEVADLLPRIDLSGCGRREWLCKTFLPTPASGWLEQSDDADTIAAKLTSANFVTDDLAAEVLASDHCTSRLAIAALRDGRAPRARAAIAARPHDQALIEHIIVRHPTLLPDAAVASGRDVADLVRAGLDQLLNDGRPSPALTQAARVWAGLLDDCGIHDLPLAHLAALAAGADRPGDAGSDNPVDQAIVDALVALGADPLTSDTARELADGWTGTLGAFSESVTGLRLRAPAAADTPAA